MFSLSNSLMTPFGSTVMSPMEENGLAPFEGGSESPSRVKADWNCLLGPPRGFGDLGRMAIYFQGAGEHWLLF